MKKPKHTFRLNITSGKGRCWYCEAKTNFVYDNAEEEIFICLKCAKLHITNKKILKKVAKQIKTNKIKI